ncbi:MAG: tetratricopeptide repeat protein [Phycisphaerales bacterium]
MNGPEHDGVAAGYYADLMRLSAAKQRQTANAEAAATTMTEAITVMEDFCTKNPTSPAARLGLVQLKLAELAANSAAPKEIQDKAKVMGEDLMKTVEASDPATADVALLASALGMAISTGVENAATRGVAVFNKVCTARPEDPYALLMRARFRAGTDTPREAVDEYTKIMQMPNQPVSPAGIALFNVRDIASLSRIEALIGMVEKAKPGDERAAALAEAKKARDDVKARPTVDNTPKLLLDAKIAWLSGDGADARKLLDQYHKACNPPFSDANALYMSAQVLRSQGLKGEAKNMLSRIVDMRLATPEVYKQLALIDVELRNLPSALNWIESAINMAPNDETLKRFREEIRTGLNPENAGPLARALAQARAALMTAPPDINTARAKGTEALSYCNELKDFYMVVPIMVQVGRVDGLTAVKRALERFPDDASLAKFKRALEIEDPVKGTVDMIDADTALKPIDKALRKYLVYMDANQSDNANKMLDEAIKLEPEHPLVTAGLFERMLAQRDENGRVKPESLAKAKELAVKAKEANLDKVEGRIYAARIAEADGKPAESIPLLERAAEIDALNPLTWRYLCNSYVQTGNLSKALAAIEQAIRIKPDDTQALVMRVRLLMNMDRSVEALNAARDASRLGITDPAFAHLWLLLESRVGDKDVAINKRAWLFDSQPENLDNSVEYIKALMQGQRLKDAKDVLDKTEAQVTKAANKNAQLQIRMLRAAFRGLQGDAPGSLDDIAAIGGELPKDQPARMEGLYVEFAELVKSMGANDFSIKVLEEGRKYQTGEFARIDRMLGDAYFGIGNWEKAKASYQRHRDASKEDENNLLQKRIIECAMKNKDFDGAQKMLDALNAEKSSDLQLILLSSQFYFAKGDRPRGMKMLDEAVRVAPDKALPYRQRGLERMSDPRTVEDAIVDFEQAVGLEPRNIDLVALLARANIRQGLPAKALTVLENAMNIQPENAALRNEHVQQLIGQQRYEDAVKSCDAASKLDANNPRWPLLKGVIYQMTGDQTTASRCFEDAWRMRRSPDTAKALADSLMAAYDGLSTKNPALLDRAAQVLADPGAELAAEPMVRLSRVTLQVRLGRHADAVNDLRAIVAEKAFNLSDPQRANALLNELPRPFKGNMKEVTKLLDEVKPSQGWPEMFRVFIARMQLADPDLKKQAKDDLENLIKSNDQSAAVAAASTLGANAYLDKEVDRSVRALQAGLAIQPDSVELNNNLAYVLCVGDKKPENALPFAIKASEKDVGNPNILDTLGVVYLELNQLDKAEEALNRARAIAPDGPTRTMPTVHLIQVKLKKKARSEADSLLNELKNLQDTEPRVKRMYAKDIEEVTKSMQTTP